jgi:hypothetical protein
MLTQRVDYPRFAKIFYSEEFNAGLVEAVNVKEREVRERVEQADGKLHLRVYVAPRVNMPVVIEKLTAGYKIGYEETIDFDPQAKHARIELATPGPLELKADIKFSEEPDGIRTRIEFEVRVKVFGVAGFAEKYIIQETKQRYVIVERELQRYVDEGRDLAEPAAQPPLEVLH